MDWVTLIILALGLSMDAFAVSVCNGLKTRVYKRRYALFTAAVFGLFQGVMPLAGYFAGSLFVGYFESFLPYISLAILAFIGIRMIIAGIKSLKKGDDSDPERFSVGAVLIQGVATSIDALAVGVSLLTFPITIWISAPVIALITFTVCAAAFVLGAKAAAFVSGKSGIAVITGGAVLVLIGILNLIR